MQKFLPFYQPILSIEDQTIFGHEVLGREKTETGYTLPEIFKKESSGKSEEFLKTENQILNQAFPHLKDPNSGYLFINMSPDEILRQLEESQGDNLPLSKITSEIGVENSRIFIEITEQSSLRDPETIGTAVEYFRELGFRIAMDDVGSESSNLERIAIIQPEIIKVDLLLLKKSLKSRSFQSVLEYLSNIAVGIGSDLLFEGIESTDEMNRAMDFGARFLQGYLLGKPSAELANPKLESKILKSHLDQFHETKRSQILEEIQFEESIRKQLTNFQPIIKHIGDTLHIDAQSLFQLSNRIKRVYATDWEGTQISPYYERSGEHGFIQNTNSLYKNWSYMPYFYKHVKKSFHNPRDWNASEPYYDKNLNSIILVFSKVIDNQVSLFIDIALQEI